MRREDLADGITIYCGDCREILPTLAKIDAVVTDPPYGVDLEGYKDDPNYVRAEVVPRFIAATCLTNVKCSSITPGIRNCFSYPQPADIGCVFFANGVGNSKWGFSCFHPVLFYGRDPYLMGSLGSRPNSIYPKNWPTEKVDHPCPKPIAWMKWMVERTSLPNWTILDPFMGSGTTGIACVKLGRKFIGIEIEPKYYDIARRRISEALRQGDMFIERPKPALQETML